MGGRCSSLLHTTAPHPVSGCGAVCRKSNHYFSADSLLLFLSEHLLFETLHQEAQPFELFQKFRARIRVADKQPLFARFEHGHFGVDVAALFDRLFNGVKQLVRAQPQPVRIVDERITRDARLFMVRLAEPAVDDDELPLRFDGVFAELCTHGHVPVDDMAVLPLDAEILQHPLAEIPALAVEVVTVVLLLMEGGVVDVQPLEALQSYREAKINLRNNNTLAPIRELFKGTEREKFFDYISEQNTNANTYILLLICPLTFE